MILSFIEENNSDDEDMFSKKLTNNDVNDAFDEYKYLYKIFKISR